MKAYLSRRYHLSASHRLHTDVLSAEENRATYGKCNNPYGHGHNYVVEVCFSGPVDAQTGMVTNLGDLDAFTRAKVLERFDVSNLNTSDLFKDLVPTTENFAIRLYEIFAEYGLARLERVRVEETERNSFEYSGGEGQATAKAKYGGSSLRSE